MTNADSPTAEAVRPWQVPTDDRPVDEALVDDWIGDLERVRPSAGDATDRPAEAPDSPGISVVVSYRGGDALDGCLRSVVDQTLARDCFEVVLVVDGGADETVADAAIDRIERDDPDLTLRSVHLSKAGVFSLRDIGVAAARRRYIAFVDADDRLSPHYLEALLRDADETTVTVAHLVEVEPGASAAEPAADTVADADTDTDTEPAVEPTADSERNGTGPADDADVSVHAALGSAAGTLVPTLLAKQVERDATPRTSQDVLFFMTMLATQQCDVRMAPDSGDATYYRSVRPDRGAAEQRPGFEQGVVIAMDLIAQLDALRLGADGRTRDLLRRQIDVEVDGLNGYLRENPDDRDRVVDVIDGHHLEYFPYDRLNAGLARALAVAYCFAPYNDSSAVVMAKRVRDRRDVVDVVYNAMDKNRERDESMRRISGPYVENELAVDTPTYFSNWAAIDSFCVQGLEKITALERVKGPYDRVYSRVMWPASHFLAAAYKLRNRSVVWTAEFSDPAARDVAGAERSSPIAPGPFLDMLRSELSRMEVPVLSSRNCLDWCEYLAYVCADHIVFTNENQRDYMLGYFAIPEVAELARAKAVISPHPTLPPSFYSMVEHPYPIDPTVANIGYFGTFYATRGLGDVLTALAGLESAERARVRLHVFTSNGKDLQRHVDEHGLGEYVRVNPYVRFLEFLNLATRFDCLVVNDALTTDSHARNPYLPSKWSDYQGSGRPVWGLVEDGSPLSGQTLDFSSPVGDVDAAAGVLRRIAEAAKAAPTTVGGPADATAEVAADATAEVAAPSPPGQARKAARKKTRPAR